MPTQLLASWLSLLVFSLAALPHASATQYSLAKEYYGSSFFDSWTYYNYYDNLTNGDVNFVSAQTAFADNLTYVDASTSHALIRVDNFTNVVWNNKRNSRSGWQDMYHVPYGVSLIPETACTLRSLISGHLVFRLACVVEVAKAVVWPQGGEIDTFEGVNLQTTNQMSLHTETGCTQVSPNETSTLVTSTNCSYAANENQGCIVMDPSSSSFGAGFSNVGGGAFVTEFASSGISVLKSQPALSNNESTIDTSTFGVPVGNWPSTGCNVAGFFQPQQLIFDITLCGDWAGNSAIFNATCSGVCYNDYVIGQPSGYDDAYFEIGYVRVFSAEGTNTVVPGSSSASGSAAPTSTSTPSSSSASSLLEKYGSIVASTLVAIGGLGSDTFVVSLLYTYQYVVGYS
ncbi:glycoside hydrolase family 16 protein [Chiua virens]|nr:glycoside hydrolase family 16 protein [Chiua virens]